MLRLRLDSESAQACRHVCGPSFRTQLKRAYHLLTQLSGSRLLTVLEAELRCLAQQVCYYF